MPKQIEVTRVAMVNRLRRRLARDGLILRMNGPRTHTYRKVGECSVIDSSRNMLIDSGSLAHFAAQYQVIADWECVGPHGMTPAGRPRPSTQEQEIMSAKSRRRRQVHRAAAAIFAGVVGDQIMDHLKTDMLRMARAGEPRPSDRSRHGLAFIAATEPQFNPNAISDSDADAIAILLRGALTAEEFRRYEANEL